RFARLLAVDARHAGAHYQAGKIALQQNRVTDAIEHLEACARLAAGNKGVHYQLWRAYRMQHDDTKADREPAPLRSLGAETDNDLDLRDRRLERIGGQFVRGVRLQPDY